MTRSSDWAGQLGCAVVAGLLLFGLYLIVQSDRETHRARHATAVIAGKEAWTRGQTHTTPASTAGSTVRGWQATSKSSSEEGLAHDSDFPTR